MGKKDDKKDEFHVFDHQLAKILDISLDRLYEVVQFFDSDPNDKWDLRLNEHYVWHNKSIGSMRFSEIGALIIAKYLDTIEKKSLWNRLKDWIQQKKRKTMQALVEIRIREAVEVGSLVKLNNRHFITKKQAIYILATHPGRFDQAFEEIRKSIKPLLINYDFADIEGVRHYSLSGFVKIAKQLADKDHGLTKPDRRLWCEVVDFSAKPVLKLLIDEDSAKASKINKAVNTAKQLAKKTCLVTGAKKTKSTPNVCVTGHHLYSKEQYPHLATALDNILVITTEIHDQFHQWMGGPQVSCTIDDFIKFVTLFYPQSPVLSKLLEIKDVLKV